MRRTLEVGGVSRYASTDIRGLPILPGSYRASFTQKCTSQRSSVAQILLRQDGVNLRAAPLAHVRTHCQHRVLGLCELARVLHILLLCAARASR